MSNHPAKPKIAATARPNAQMAMSGTARARMRATEKAIYKYYNDMGRKGGNCTWGAGILAHHGICSAEELGRKVNAQSVDIVFGQKVAEAEGIVRRNVQVTLNQAQFDALCSLTFNAGAGRVTDTFAFVNKGDYAGAAANMSKMIKVTIIKGGRRKLVTAPGLIKRRAEESAPFRHRVPDQITAE